VLAAVFDGETYLVLVSAEDMAEAHWCLTFLQRGPAAPPAGGPHRIRRSPGRGPDPIVEIITAAVRRRPSL
jgi:hypothetical protein